MISTLYDICFFTLCGFLIYILFSNIFQKISAKKKNFIYDFSDSFYVTIISILQFFMILSFSFSGYMMYYEAINLTLFFLFFVNFFIVVLSEKFLILKAVIFNIFNVFVWAFCTSEVYVTKFKGEPYTINDIGAAKTAFSVAGNYDYTPNFSIILGSIFLFIVLFIGNRFLFCKEVKLYLIEPKKSKANFIYFFISFILSVPVLISFNFNRELISDMGEVNLFQKDLAVTNYGYPLFFYVESIMNRFEYPEDYNEEEILSKIDDIEEDSIDENSPSAVNVICILDEAFYDVSLITPVEPDKDYLENYHNMDKNTLKGYSVVSTYGGGTANSEYEFLLQGNLRFLPKASYPFTSFINKETSSLASILKDQGFKTIAYHPYKKENWNRDSVYKLIGFDEFLSEEDIVHTDEDDFSYTGLLDSVCFKDIIDIYENKKEGEKLFIYTVTMQNHSPYQYEDESKYLSLINDSVRKGDKVMNNYLSLISLSDKAIKELCDYFDSIDEPTVILLFGDHAPGGLFDYNKVAVNNYSNLRIHSTPYFIHTNFDATIPEIGSEVVSLSYLQSLLMDMANLKKDKEQILVQSYMDKYPVLNSSTYGTLDELYLSEDCPEDLYFYRNYCYTKLKK